MVAQPADRAPGRPPLDDVVVVPMRRRHLRGVMAIEQAVYPRSWSPALFASELDQPETRRYLVALSAAAAGRGLRRRQVVVGYAGLLLQGDPEHLEGHITTVAVHPAHHRRKIASRLLVALLREAIDLGVQAATLEVRAANRGAQRLYSGFGFVPVGVRPGYYAETGEDAVLMWAYELQSPAFAARLARQAARLSEPGGASGAPDLHVPWVKGRVGLPSGPRPPTDRDRGPR
ncbi:MAG TPA: ribosomal protein S18-alanine N-acetyltransferase [Egibacteraceae bacterium]